MTNIPQTIEEQRNRVLSDPDPEWRLFTTTLLLARSCSGQPDGVVTLAAWCAQVAGDESLLPHVPAALTWARWRESFDSPALREGLDLVVDLLTSIEEEEESRNG